MAANIVRHRSRSALRDVGGFGAIRDFSRSRRQISITYEHVRPEVLQQTGIDPTVGLHSQLLQLSNEILDCPRHLSIHPGGFLLGHERCMTSFRLRTAAWPDAP